MSTRKKIPPPAKHNTLLPSVYQEPVKTPSLGNTFLQGISLGIGNSIGHKIVNGIFDQPKTNEKLENKHNDLLKKYHECIQNSNGTFEEKMDCELKYLEK
jgi:hypothetical protein